MSQPQPPTPSSASSSAAPPSAAPPSGARLWRRGGLILLFLAVIGGAGMAGINWRDHLEGNFQPADVTVMPSQPVIPSGPPVRVNAAPPAGALHCDVLVVGGTPSGVAAALAAARRGASVVLVESHARIGGDIVYAMNNMFDIPVDACTQSSPDNRGIFGEYYAKLGIGFPIDKASHLMTLALEDNPNIEVRLNTRVISTFVPEGRLTGVMVQAGDAAPEPISFTACIDATNDADVAAMAGAGFYIGRETSGRDRRMQAAGLLFSVKDADWSQVINYVHTVRVVPYSQVKDVTAHRDAVPVDIRLIPSSHGGFAGAKIREGGVAFNYAWERGDLVKAYVPHGRDIVVCSMNFGHQLKDNIVLNSVNIVGVNGLDPLSREEGRAEAIKELPFFMDYLRAHVPGFQHAELDQIAPELYIRETRHLNGLYTLTQEDVEHEVKFPDRIGLASYPIDLHYYKRGEPNPFGAKHYYYTIPLRSLVPENVDGLFVASRSLSATWVAAGSARVTPATMAAGEGAGAAAWVCVKENVSPQQVALSPDYVSETQDSLREHGANLGDEYPAGQP